MMREFEITYWAALNSPEEINKIINENINEAEGQKLTVEALRTRFIMTAYFTKQKLSMDRTE